MGGIGKKHYDVLLKNKNKVTVVDKKFNKFNIQKIIKNNNFDYSIIATPPNSHLMYSRILTKAKIPFLVEKPLGNNLKGWKELISLTQKKKLICGVAYPRRHHHFFESLKEEINSGFFGRIKFIKCNFSQDFRKYRKDYNRTYYSQRNNGGGVVTDALIHHINLASYFFGAPKLIYSKVEKLEIKNLNVEDFAHVVMKYNKNIYGIFFSNHFQKNYEDNFEVVGTKGTISVYREKNEAILRFNDKKPKVKKINFDWNLFLSNQIKDFEKSIKNRNSVKTSLSDALRDLNICKQILNFKRN